MKSIKRKIVFSSEEVELIAGFAEKGRWSFENRTRDKGQRIRLIKGEQIIFISVYHTVTREMLFLRGDNKNLPSKPTRVVDLDHLKELLKNG